MVDVGGKEVTERRAVARAVVKLSPETAAAVARGDAPKGDVISTARLAGIQAAKRTAELIPLCHPLPLSFVNVVDVPPLCNFILPAIIRTGPLAIAISTAGASPALAKRIRDEIADEYGEPYARLALLLNEVRGWAKATLPTYQDRKVFFESIVNGDPDPVELLRHGDEAAARDLIEAARQSHQPV